MCEWTIFDTSHPAFRTGLHARKAQGITKLGWKRAMAGYMPGMATRLFAWPTLFAILWILFPGFVSAQSVTIRNAADRTLPWVSEINPAVISFQPSRVGLGIKSFHVGFLPDDSFGLRESRVNLSLPYVLPLGLGFGTDVRYFRAGVYSELAASVLLSRELFSRFGVGFKFGIERREFTRENFNLKDNGDPLLAQKLAVSNQNLGAGLYWNPGNLQIGAGVSYLNRPNIGQTGAVQQPRQIHAALGYRLGLLTPTFLASNDGFQWRFGFSVTADKPGLGSLRVGYEDGMPLRVSASLNLTRSSRLDYNADLPGEGTRGASAGTQELVFNQILGRKPEIGQPEIMLSHRKLFILHETVLRSMAPELTPAVLASLPELSPSYLKPKKRKDNLLVFVAGRLGAFETRDVLIRRYIELRDRISALMRRDTTLQLIILANEKSLFDAKQIRQVIGRQIHRLDHIRIARLNIQGQPDLRGSRSGKVSVQRLKPRLSAPFAEIALQVQGKTRETKRWDLSIVNSRGKIVRVFSGAGSLPGKIQWDWRDDAGRIVPPGRYLCGLRVRTPQGNKRLARSQPIAVAYIKRKVMIRFQSEPLDQSTKKIQASIR